jgi:hypothetical protein
MAEETGPRAGAGGAGGGSGTGAPNGTTDAATPPASDGGSPLTEFTAEWPVKAADGVDALVDLVRDRIVRPILLVARFLVYGLVALFLLVVIAVVLSVALIRLLDVYVFPGRVWASYALVGVVFTIVGIVAWWQRTPRAGDDGVPSP